MPRTPTRDLRYVNNSRDRRYDRKASTRLKPIQAEMYGEGEVMVNGVPIGKERKEEYGWEQTPLGVLLIRMYAICLQITGKLPSQVKENKLESMSKAGGAE